MNTQIDWRHTDFLDVIEQEMHITICLYDDTGEFYLGAPGQHYLPGEWSVLFAGADCHSGFPAQ